MSERVLSHFKAVQKFLGELPENMREKMASEQCSRLLQALSDMPRLDFHTLASLAQTVKETNFSEGEKEQLVSSMSKLAGSSDAEVKSGRRVLQNYTSFPALMLKADYAKIQSPDMKHGERLDYLIDWLGRCGLRCPTEMSMAMITAVFQLSVGAHVHADQLHSLYLTVKGKVKAGLAKLPACSEHLAVLPTMASELPGSLQKLVYPNGPPGKDDLADVDLMSHWQVAQQIPLRKTNKSLVQVAPSAQSLLAQHMAQLAQMQMHMAGMGSGGQMALNFSPALPMQQPLLALPAPPSSSMVPVASVSHPPAAQVMAIADRAVEEKPVALVSVSRENGEMQKQPVSDVTVQSVSGKVEIQNHASPQGRAEVDEKMALARSCADLKADRKRKADPDCDGMAAVSEPRADKPVSKTSQVSEIGQAKAKAEPKPSKKPAAKKPSKKESAKKGSKKESAKKPSKKDSGVKLTSIERAQLKQRVLLAVPLSLRRKWQNGCSSCRYVKSCTLSCWKKRGFS